MVCFKCLCCASGFGTVLEVFVVDILQCRMRPLFNQTQFIQWIINWIAFQIRAINAQLSEKIRFEISYHARTITLASVRQQTKNPRAIISIFEIITIHKHCEPTASLTKWVTLNATTKLASIIQAAYFFPCSICN